MATEVKWTAEKKWDALRSHVAGMRRLISDDSYDEGYRAGLNHVLSMMHSMDEKEGAEKLKIWKENNPAQ